MTSTLKTFNGSLGEFIAAIGKSPPTPPVGKWIPFFKAISDLRKDVVEPLYSNNEDILTLRKSLSKLNTNLRKIHQYFCLSRQKKGERDFANEDIAWAVDDFNKSLPPGLNKWKRSSPPIKKIKKLIDYSGTWKNILKGGSKFGRPPKPFNVLIFHVVNRFTYRCFDAKRNPIKRNGKYKVRKNWQLICAALLRLQMYYEIPEIKAFIETHKTDEASLALKRLTAIIKKEFQNFRRSGKGDGKFAGAFEDGSEFLDVYVPYSTKDGIGNKLL